MNPYKDKSFHYQIWCIAVKNTIMWQHIHLWQHTPYFCVTNVAEEWKSCEDLHFQCEFLLSPISSSSWQQRTRLWVMASSHYSLIPPAAITCIFISLTCYEWMHNILIWHLSAMISCLFFSMSELNLRKIQCAVYGIDSRSVWLKVLMRAVVYFPKVIYLNTNQILSSSRRCAPRQWKKKRVRQTLQAVLHVSPVWPRLHFLLTRQLSPYSDTLSCTHTDTHRQESRLQMEVLT